MSEDDKVCGQETKGHRTRRHLGTNTHAHATLNPIVQNAGRGSATRDSIKSELAGGGNDGVHGRCGDAEDAAPRLCSPACLVDDAPL